MTAIAVRTLCWAFPRRNQPFHSPSDELVIMRETAPGFVHECRKNGPNSRSLTYKQLKGQESPSSFHCYCETMSSSKLIVYRDLMSGRVNEFSAEAPANLYLRAIYDYQSGNVNRLSFRRDAIIKVTKLSSSGWWYGIVGNGGGWFPCNYCITLSADDPRRRPPHHAGMRDIV